MTHPDRTSRAVRGPSVQVLGVATRPHLALKPAAAAVAVALVALGGGARNAWAAPTDGVVSAGNATILQSGATTTINQTSSRVAIDWRTFGINANETVNFQQPSSSSVALNRVGPGGGRSEIYGALTANGQVFLINPSGVLFSKTATVDVAGLVASTLNITNHDFMAGRYVFSGGSGSGPHAGSVINDGKLRAANGGYIALIGNHVSNTGSITAANGTVALGAGESMVLDFHGDGLLSLKVNTAAAKAKIENSGEIHAEGGAVIMSARAKGALLDTVLNVDGIVTAKGIVERDGHIYLDGGPGVTRVAGTLDASSAQARGGEIRVLGEYVGLFGGAKLDASGASGGGTVLVGGDYQGRNASVANAYRTYVGPDAQIKADALSAGDGGKVIVWADDSTKYYGAISARGGAQSGDGGFVEVSGRQNLEFSGRVDVSAANGKAGSLLLDPLVINLQGGSGAGADDGQLPTTAFDTDPAATYQISEAALEAVAAGTITLEARNSITTSGAFDNVTANPGDGAGVLALQNGVNILMRTRNDATDGSGSINLLGLHLKTAGAGSATLTAGTGAAGGNTGSVLLGNVTSQGTGAITVSNGGVGGLTLLTGDLLTSGGSVTLSGTTFLGANVLIDTEQGNSTAGGAVTLSSAGISGSGSAGRTLTIDTSTGAPGLAGGNVILGSFDSAGGNSVHQLSVTTSGGAGGTPGLVLLAGSVLLDDNAAGTPASFAVNNAAPVFVLGTVMIDTEQGNDAAGGAVTLTNAAMAGLLPGSSLIIDTSTTAPGLPGGAVSLGSFGNAGGLGVFLNQVSVITAGGGAGLAGTLTLNGDIFLDDNAGAPAAFTFGNAGDIFLASNVTIDTEQGGDAAGGAVSLGSAALSGLSAPRNLTIDTSTALAGAAGGTVTLGNFGSNAGFHLNQVSVTTAPGAGGAPGVITLAGNVLLDDLAGAPASFAISNPTNLFLLGDVVIDTEQGDSAPGGAVTLTDVAISGFGAPTRTLTIDTSTALAGSTGGAVSLGSFGNFGGIFSFLNRVSVTTGAPGATAGTLTLNGNILLDDNAAGISASFILNNPAPVFLASNILIDSEQGGDAAGGSVTLANAAISGTGAGRTLTIDTSTALAGAVGGDVSLGTFDAAGGSFVNQVSLTTSGPGGGGIVTLHGDVSLDDNAGAAASFTLNNPADVFLAGNVTLDTEQGGDAAGGAVNLANATISGVGVDPRNLVIDTSTALAGANGGAVSLGTFGSNGGLFVNELTVSTAGGGAGGIDGLTTLLSGGTITTSGAQTYNGPVAADNVNLTTLGTGGHITATNAGNDFTGTLILNTTGVSNVALTDMNAIAFGASALGSGTFTANAVGITQSGAFTQEAGAGATTFNGGAGVITLELSNDFTGAVSLNNTGANTVLLNDSNALELGASSVGSDLFVFAGGAMTVSGAVSTGNNGNIALMASSGSLTIGQNVTANGTGTVDLRAGGATSDIAFTGGTVSSAFGLLQLIAGQSITSNSATGVTTELSSFGGVRFDAGTTIGTSTNSIDIATPLLAATAGGDVFINVLGPVTVGALGGLNAALPIAGIATTGSNGAITLRAAGDIIVAENVSANGSGAVSLTATNSGGILTVDDQRSVSSTSGAITLVADDMVFDLANAGARVSTTGNVTLKPFDTTRIIAVGTDTPSTLGLSALELDRVTAGTLLTIGAADHTGAMFITANTAPANAPNVMLINNTSGIDILADLTATNNLTLIANGGGAAAGMITRSTGNGFLTGPTVTLDSATGIGSGALRVFTSAGSLAARSTTSGGVFITETSGVTLDTIGGVANGAGGGAAYDVLAGGAITVSAGVNTSGTGNTTLRATAGDIAVGADVGNATGDTALTSDAGSLTRTAGTVMGNNVTLQAASGIGSAGGANSVFTAAATLSATNTGPTGNISIVESNGVTLVALTHTDLTNTSGTLSLTSTTGDIGLNDVSAVSQGGLITLAATAGAIIDGDGGTSLTIISPGAVTLTAANGIGANADAIDTAVTSLSATNTAANNIVIINATSPVSPLTLTGITNSGVDGAVFVSNAETINSTGAINATGDVALIATGGASDINILNNITVTNAAARTLTLRADRDVVIGDGATALNLAAGGAGALNMDFNSNRDGDAVNGGGVFFNSTGGGGGFAINVTTNGGFVKAHGGTTDTTRAIGSIDTNVAATSRRHGVAVAGGTTINSGAGLVGLYGQGTSEAGTQSHFGVSIAGSILTNGGSVTLDGVGGANSGGTGSAFGVNFSNGTVDTSAGNGSISITGLGGTVAGTGVSHGVTVGDNNNTGTGSTVKAGSGGITIDGTGNAGASGSASGVFVSGGTQPGGSTVQTINGGAIMITGAGGTTGAATGVSVHGIQLGSGNNAGANVEIGTITTDTGAITLTGTGGATTNQTAGGSNNAIGAGIRLSNGSSVTATAAGSASLTGTGGSGNTAARYAGIFTSSDQSAPVQPNNTIGGASATGVLVRSLGGTGIILNNTNVSANTTNGTVTLNATGGGNIFGGSANITANGLRVLADSAASVATLNSLGNNVNTLAALLSGPGSSLNFRDSSALQVGSVLTTNGVTVAGPITLRSGGLLSQTAGNVVSGSVLTTNSVDGTALNEANTVTSFNATNSGSGDIALTNTANPLNITGISNTAANGNASVANTGPINVTGAISTAPDGNVVLNSSGTVTISAPVTAGGAGAITLTANGGDLLLNDLVSSTSGPITLTSAQAIVESAGVGTTAIRTSGLLTTQSNDGQLLGFSNEVGSFNATNDGAGATGDILFYNRSMPLTITGATNTSPDGVFGVTNESFNPGISASITTTGPINTNGDITLVAIGAISDINILNNIVVTNAAAKTLTLWADRDVVVGDGVTPGGITLVGTGGALNMDFNSNRDDTVANGGAVFFNSAAASSIDVFTNGGSVTAHGGSIAGQRAMGSSDTGVGATSRRHGVSVASGTTINTGAGNVTLLGQGFDGAGTQSHHGVSIAGSIVSNGSVTLDGIGGGGGTAGSAIGVNFANGSIDASGGGGLISITGLGGTVASGTGSSTGVSVGDNNNAGSGSTVMGGAGGVTITGTGNASATNSAVGVNISGGSQAGSSTVRTINGGGISITGTGGTTGLTSGVSVAGIQLGSGSNTFPPSEKGTITTDTGAITLTGTGGTTTSQAASGGVGAGVRILNGSAATASGAGSVAMTGTGGSGNTASKFNGVFASSDQSAPAQPLNTIGGASATGVLVRSLGGTGITLSNTNVSANTAGGTVTLNATGGGNINGGTTTQIVADRLRVLADTAASVATLTSSGNSVSTLAASLSGAGSSLNYRDSNALQVGSVTSAAIAGNAATNTNGIDVLGNVTLRSGGILNQAGGSLINGAALSTNSVGGTVLNDANSVTSFNGTNSGSGNISLNNTMDPLTITGVSNTGTDGGLFVTNNGFSISTTGPITTNGDVLLTATGGTSDINILSDVVVTNAAAKTLTLRADRDVVVGDALVPVINLSGSGPGALNMDFNSDRDGSGINGGGVLFNSTFNAVINVATNGGFVKAHGGTSDTTRASGSIDTNTATTSRRNGVGVLSGTTINSGAGAVTMYGQGTTDAGSQSHHGIGISGTIVTNGGNVTLDGIGGANSTGGGNALGVNFANGTVDTAAGSGAITITGLGGTVGGTGLSAGVGINDSSDNTGAGSALRGGPGGITITGTGNANATSSASGVYIYGGTQPGGSTVQTINGGAITITGFGGTTSASTNGAVNGVQVGRGSSTNLPLEFGTITSGTGVITVNGTGGTATNQVATFGSTLGAGVRLSNGSAISVTGAGSVSITGEGGSGSTPVRYAGVVTNADPAAMNIIGGANATGVVIRSLGGTGINLGNTNVSANTANGTITLNATGGGNISAGSSNFVAANLRVLADAAASVATLNSSGNNVNTLAASLAGANSSLSYRDSNALQVGSVLGTNGISVTGPVTLQSGGALSQSAGSIISGSVLTTSSVDGTSLGAANTVTSFNATNSGSGDIGLTNTASPLTITGISNTAVSGNTAVDNMGAIVIGGAISTQGTARLTSSSTISGTGQVSGDAVALDSATGVGSSGARVNTAAGTLAARSRTSGGVFVNEVSGVVTLSTVSGVVNGAAGGGAYDITGGGIISVGTALTSSGAVSLASPGGTLLRADITTTGPISLLGESVALFTDVTLDAGSGDITLGGAVDGPGSRLVLNSAGTTLLMGPVGGANRLTSLTTNAGGTTVIGGGGVTTIAEQSYGDALILGANTTLTGGTPTFGSTVAGAGFDLTLNFSGTTDINTGFTGVRDLTTGNGGLTRLGGAISTTGAQTYNDAVALMSNTTLAGTAGTFGSSLAGAGFDLTLNFSGTTAINSSFTGIRDLTTGNGGQTVLSGAITTTGVQTYNDAVTLGANTTLTGTTPTFGSTIVGSGFDLALNFSGTTDLAGAALSGVRNLATGAGGTTRLTGTIATSGMQTYNDAAVLLADTTLDAAANNVTFAGPLTGPFTLTVNSTGATVFGGTATLAALTTNAGGTTAINGGAVTTTGNQVFNDSVLLGANTVLNAGAGNISFAGTLDGAFGLTLNSGGTTTLGGLIGAGTPLASLTTDAGGTTLITASTINTTGSQLYGDALTLGADTTLTSSAANITFGSTIDADAAANNRTLTVNAPVGTVTFSGNVGASQALADLDVLAGPDTIVFNAAAPQLVNVNAGGGNTVSFTGNVRLDQSLTVNTDGASDNNVSLNSPINADSGSNGRTLDITAGTGNVTLGRVGNTQPPGRLTVNGNQLLLNGDVQTNGGGPIDFTNVAGVLLGAPTVLLDTDATGGTTRAGDILFGPTTTIDAGPARSVLTLNTTADGGGATGAIDLGVVGPNVDFVSFGEIRTIAGVVPLVPTSGVDGSDTLRIALEDVQRDANADEGSNLRADVGATASTKPNECEARQPNSLSCD